MNGTHLTGLTGTNPLGFLAALGVQVLFDHEEDQPRLWWTDDIIPHAVVDARFDVERIIDQAINVSLPAWRTSPALNPRIDPKGDQDAKYKPDDIRKYLKLAQNSAPGSSLASSVIAEGSLDGNERAKPTDLYFTAARQLFFKMAQEILDGTTKADLKIGLTQQWRYESTLPSLMWDVADDRIYALSSFNPAKEKKLTNPGPEALAILGLSRHPVFAKAGRTLTQGCSGRWKRGSYTWPLWEMPAGVRAVKSILAHGSHPHPQNSRTRRSNWYRSWGIHQVLQSSIRRSDQGGFGTFGPPEIIWRHL